MGVLICCSGDDLMEGEDERNLVGVEVCWWWWCNGDDEPIVVGAALLQFLCRAEPENRHVFPLGEMLRHWSSARRVLQLGCSPKGGEGQMFSWLQSGDWDLSGVGL